MKRPSRKEKKHNAALWIGIVGLVVFGAITSSVVRADAGPCILVLGSGSGVVDVTGSANISGSQCKITVNSVTTPAITVSGSAKVTAGSICAPGNYKKSGSASVSPLPSTTCPSVDDPFISVVPPAVGACTHMSLSVGGSGNKTLNPGVYCNGLTIGGSTKVTLNPGIYVIKGGQLRIGGSAHATGDGVVFYFTEGSNGFVFDGSSKVSLVAPSLGDLSGFVLYRPASEDTSISSTISGSSRATLQGITYLPTQKLSITGSAKNIATSFSSFVLGSVQVQGSATLRASGSLPLPVPDTTPPAIAPSTNISVEAPDTTGVAVTYTNPAAIDNRDGAVQVSCIPASGSVFAVGTTTVVCSAHDAAGNQAVATFDVGVYVTAPPPDTTPPTIAPSADITVAASGESVVVSYDTPIATDNIDGTVPVSCTLPSGSSFFLGTTTITCVATDAAGNSAQSTFDIGVYKQQPTEIVMASQPDESTLCTPNWRDCYTGGEAQIIIALGSGSLYQGAEMKSITIAKQDDISGTGEFVVQPWALTVLCFTDAAYTNPCGLVSSQTTVSPDNIHWSALFNFTFNPSNFYQLIINDDGWSISAYGSPTVPYWVMKGLTQ